MAVLNYTTTISAARTVREIQDMLARHGADAIGVRYADRQPVGVYFQLTGPGGGQQQSYTLPVDVAAMSKLLAAQHADGTINTKNMRRDVLLSNEHAARVAWRVVKDWLEAQLAIIETQMVAFDQVMLPYLITGPNSQTLYDEYRTRELPS